MSKELDNVRGEKVTLKIHGKEREIKFGFSAWAILEREYKGLKNLEKILEQVEEMPFNTLPHLIYVALVDKEGVTEENILDDYTLADIGIVSGAFNKAIALSLPSSEKKAVTEAN